MADDKKETWYEEQERLFLEKEKEHFIKMFGPMPDPEEKLFQGKGIIPQIEDKHALFGPNKELTEEKLMSFLQDIMASPDAPKPMILITGCIDQGLLYQSPEQINLCNNPNCKTCRNLEDALKEQCK